MGKARENVELAKAALEMVTAAFMLWQIAKMAAPQLQVHEDIFIEKLARKFGRKHRISQREADEFAAEVTRYVRSYESE